jgi:SAM-dependent methyltransferase
METFAIQLFETLRQINTRPDPFQYYTAEELWTDPRTSEKMLCFHLNPGIDVASRNAAFIRRSVDWIAARFNVGKGSMVADFGCGPGLYTQKLAGMKADVTGIDFSKRSISHARKAAEEKGLDIRYVEGNYLDFETGDRFDLILMIMCDFCALSPVQRKRMLEKFKRLLLPGGAVLLDVYSLNAFEGRREAAICEENLLDGFWSPDKYYGFLNTFKYDAEKVVLDKYTIVEADGIRTVYNWLQYFSPWALEQEFAQSGLEVERIIGDVAGASFDPTADEFAVIGRKYR